MPYRLLESVSVHTATAVTPSPLRGEGGGEGLHPAPSPDNLLIQGDNLEALMALLPFYRGPFAPVPTLGYRTQARRRASPTPVASRYSGRYQFPKHYFPVLADLKDDGQEFACTQLIDRHPKVRHRVRNLDTAPCGFALTTSRGRFFPDRRAAGPGTGITVTPIGIQTDVPAQRPSPQPSPQGERE